MNTLKLVLALFLVPLVVLSGCSASFTTASLSELTMAKRVDSKSQEPLEKGSVFSTDAPEIYCTVKLSSAPPDTKVKATWIATDVEGVEKDFVVDSVSVSAEGSRYLSFSLTKPNRGWPTGKYAVVLYVDEKQVGTVPFSVAK